MAGTLAWDRDFRRAGKRMREVECGHTLQVFGSFQTFMSASHNFKGVLRLKIHLGESSLYLAPHFSNRHDHQRLAVPEEPLAKPGVEDLHPPSSFISVIPLNSLPDSQAARVGGVR